MFGMTPFTLFHVVISLIGIVSGFVVAYGLLTSKRLDEWTLGFLITTAATSVTGFFFPIHGMTPALIVGVISMILLIVAIVARYAYRMEGVWRWTYAVTALTSLWFNVFVLVAQSFQKIPTLHALAPTQSEPPFLIVQGIVLVSFVLIGVFAVRRFRPSPA
jgi:hypothetical protein